MNTNQQDIVHALPYMLAYPALLAGHQTIDEAMNDHLLSNYLDAFMEQDALAEAGLPSETDSDEGRRPALSHFFGLALSDPLARLCSDGAPKLPTYILPILLDLLANNGDVHRIAFLLATYGHYLSEYLNEESGAHTSDALQADDRAKINSDDVVALLGISSMATARLQTYAHFVAMYKSYRTQIATYGVEFLLRQMAYNRLARPSA